jgi:putative ATP-binding cassette transporter
MINSKVYKWFILILVCGIILSIVETEKTLASTHASDASKLPNEKIEKIEGIVQDAIDKADIPGMSIVIVEGDETVYSKGFGYSNIEDQTPIQSDTLFELGSNSKAFTALGILNLEADGLIQLDDSVQMYLPWFSMHFEGEVQDITINQLLHHTSGIKLDTINQIPASDDPDALEQTVRTLVGQELRDIPGNDYQYATINYDVLGLIIQTVSGQSYVDYMEQEIFKPLGLNDTYVNRERVEETGRLATGYKYAFTKNVPSEVPYFRGNMPAGYITLSPDDMARWLKIQLGTVQIPEKFEQIINQSHIPNRTLPPISYNGASYAKGWEVYQRGTGEMQHGGLNPTFSSYIIYRPGDQIGVAVLNNLGAEMVWDVAAQISNVMKGQPYESIDQYNLYKSLDTTATWLIVILSLFVIYIVLSALKMIYEIIRGKRKFKSLTMKDGGAFAFSILFMAGFIYCIYHLPKVFLYQRLEWNTVYYFLPVSLIATAIVGVSAGLLFYLYNIIGYLFPKQREASYFSLVTLSLFSGLGNAIVIFMITMGISRVGGGGMSYDNANDLIIYFVMGMILYIYGQKIIRKRLVTITNNLVYDKRMKLVNLIFKSHYHKIERLGDGRIHAVLNNDSEVVSQFANIFIGAITSLITVMACLTYLAVIDFYALFISLGVLGIAAVLYYLIGMSANRYMEQSRDIQNVFFKFLDDIVQGFKVLYINKSKTHHFIKDVEFSSQNYRSKRIKADLMFANVFVLGELLFVFVIGMVVFLLPLWFAGVNTSTVTNYALIFLYMMGPITIILNSVPQLIQCKISWNRMKQMEQELESLKSTEIEQATRQNLDLTFESMSLEELTYSYADEQQRSFTVGPLNLTFEPGQITFITGGNGSGKSTLVKLMIGLYVPDKGKVVINGERKEPEELGAYFSVTFSDAYLFQKLYGIEHEGKQEIIAHYLELLHLKDKVSIENGKFSTTQLSSGQRKRLALLISYLEDKPILIFDEWAADQDPQFRAFFYNELLPDMKKAGKCVIAISHDDRYFDRADKIIKLDMGQVQALEHAENVKQISAGSE